MGISNEVTGLFLRDEIVACEAADVRVHCTLNTIKEALAKLNLYVIFACMNWAQSLMSSTLRSELVPYLKLLRTKYYWYLRNFHLMCRLCKAGVDLGCVV